MKWDWEQQSLLPFPFPRIKMGIFPKAQGGRLEIPPGSILCPGTNPVGFWDLSHLTPFVGGAAPSGLLGISVLAFPECPQVSPHQALWAELFAEGPGGGFWCDQGWRVLNTERFWGKLILVVTPIPFPLNNKPLAFPFLDTSTTSSTLQRKPFFVPDKRFNSLK